MLEALRWTGWQHPCTAQVGVRGAVLTSSRGWDQSVGVGGTKSVITTCCNVH
jgi:hypothetical protein